jgi:hypothetical protein
MFEEGMINNCVMGGKNVLVSNRRIREGIREEEREAG